MDEIQLTKYREMIKRSAHYRGMILHTMSILEEYIDEIIANHFCSDADKIHELKWVMLASEKVTLQNKFNLVVFIYEKHYPDFFNKYDVNPHGKRNNANKNEYDEFKSFNTRVSNMISLRNKIAHRKYNPLNLEEIDTYSGSINFKIPVGKSGKIEESDLIINNETINVFADGGIIIENTFKELLKLVKNAKDKQQESL